MAGDPDPQPRPTVSAPSSRVTIAFPFSSVKLADASDDVRKLAAIVAALSERVAALEPSAENEALVQQARELLTHLT